MHMNDDPEWLRQKAESEDGGFVSAGGLVHDLEQTAASPPIAILRLRRPDGITCEWPIGALPGTDNEETLRAHCRRWFPQCEFLGFEWET